MKRGLFVALVGLALLVGLFAWAFKGRRTAPVGVETNAPVPVTNVVPVTGPQMHSQPGSLKASYVPPEVSSAELRKLVDRRVSFEERVRGTTTGAIFGVKDERDLEGLVQVLSDPTEDDTVRHEIAFMLFRSEFTGLEAELFRILENPAEKERFRGWAAQHLGNLLLDDRYPRDRRVLAERLRALLTDRHMDVQREAILALARHGDAAVLAKVREMLSDPAPGADAMRDMAIRCVRENNLREHIPMVRSYARSTNDVIRIAALVTLREWGDEESRPVFEEAAQSTVVRLQHCGKAALMKLDKQSSQPSVNKEAGSVLPPGS